MVLRNMARGAILDVPNSTNGAYLALAFTDVLNLPRLSSTCPFALMLLLRFPVRTGVRSRTRVAMYSDVISSPEMMARRDLRLKSAELSLRFTDILVDGVHVLRFDLPMVEGAVELCEGGDEVLTEARYLDSVALVHV